MADLDDDTIIELTDVVSKGSELSGYEDIIELTDIVEDTNSDLDIVVDREQIETILEQIIEKKFADKIESILFEVMEKVIEKQIIEIKESLQKNLEQITSK